MSVFYLSNRKTQDQNEDILIFKNATVAQQISNELAIFLATNKRNYPNMRVDKR